MSSLTEIATKHGTDKVCHKFTEVYAKAFEKLRDKPLHILEIGIWKGESLRTFKEYFPLAKIYGIDIHDKSQYIEDRIDIERGDQSDTKFLETVFPGIIFDIIIDDGSHHMHHQQISLEYLMPRLKEGGLYILEDLHTSTNSWPMLGGGDDKPNTTLKLLNDLNSEKNLIDHCFYIKDINKLKTQIKNLTVYYTRGMESITSLIYKN